MMRTLERIRPQLKLSPGGSVRRPKAPVIAPARTPDPQG
jgi:hypothetical protein